MKNSILVFLSLLAISATNRSDILSSTSDKVYCQKLSETNYDVNGEMTRDSRYNYNGKELISINGINNAERVYTTLSDNSREYRVLGFEERGNQNNREIINEYGLTTYIQIHKTDQMELSLLYEYEDHLFEGTDKMFCRLKSCKIEVSNQPSADYKTIYNYRGDKLISITRGDVDSPVEYLDDYTRIMPYSNGRYSIQTLNKYGKVLVSKNYTKKGEYTGKDVYTYLFQ